jgi:hypothetical protein
MGLRILKFRMGENAPPQKTMGKGIVSGGAGCVRYALFACPPTQGWVNLNCQKWFTFILPLTFEAELSSGEDDSAVLFGELCVFAPEFFSESFGEG